MFSYFVRYICILSTVKCFLIVVATPTKIPSHLENEITQDDSSIVISSSNIENSTHLSGNSIENVRVRTPFINVLVMNTTEHNRNSSDFVNGTKNVAINGPIFPLLTRSIENLKTMSEDLDITTHLGELANLTRFKSLTDIFSPKHTLKIIDDLEDKSKYIYAIKDVVIPDTKETILSLFPKKLFKRQIESNDELESAMHKFNRIRDQQLPNKRHLNISDSVTEIEASGRLAGLPPLQLVHHVHHHVHHLPRLPPLTLARPPRPLLLPHARRLPHLHLLPRPVRLPRLIPPHRTSFSPYPPLIIPQTSFIPQSPLIPHTSFIPSTPLQPYSPIFLRTLPTSSNGMSTESNISSQPSPFIQFQPQLYLQSEPSTAEPWSNISPLPSRIPTSYQQNDNSDDVASTPAAISMDYLFPQNSISNDIQTFLSSEPTMSNKYNSSKTEFFGFDDMDIIGRANRPDISPSSNNNSRSSISYKPPQYIPSYAGLEKSSNDWISQIPKNTPPDQDINFAFMQQLQPFYNVQSEKTVPFRVNRDLRVPSALNNRLELHYRRVASPTPNQYPFLSSSNPRCIFGLVHPVR